MNQSYTTSPTPSRDDDFWRWYDTYLQTPEWETRRKAVMARARNTCEGCQAADATQVHHLTYERVGNEMLFDLVAVCDDCHAQIHNPDAAKREARPSRLEGCTCVGTFKAMSCPHHGAPSVLKSMLRLS